MKILYVSSVCSKSEYKNLYCKSSIKPGLQAQKYHRLMVEGFDKNENVDIYMLSAIPMSRNIDKKFYFKSKIETINKKIYRYICFINIPIIRQITLFFGAFRYSLKWITKNKDGVVICDVLNVSVSMASCLAAKIFKVKCIGIVTDVPGYFADNNKKQPGPIKGKINSIKTKINNMLINKFDGYVFLTEYMNELINKNEKEYIVIEGQVDIEMNDIENSIDNKYDKKICIYAGSLKKIYGIKNLIEGFIKANVSNSELHIYGSGNFEDELKQIALTNENIKYFGVKENEYVVNEQIKATLLINPRPTTEEYTKYSFPSKNMEYMVSGTPVLTTNLPGMPKEYLDYVYVINDESVGGIANIIGNVLSKSDIELYNMGKKSKEYVIKNKNNVSQAQRIINMINNMKRN